MDWELTFVFEYRVLDAVMAHGKWTFLGFSSTFWVSSLRYGGFPGNVPNYFHFESNSGARCVPNFGVNYHLEFLASCLHFFELSNSAQIPRGQNC